MATTNWLTGDNMKYTLINKLNYKIYNNQLYIKREDLLPISFGGNKVRKALLFLEDIQRHGSDCIVTYGSSNSNHCRVIANIAASHGIPCYIISPIETKQITNNNKLVNLFGAKIITCKLSEVSRTIEIQLNELRSNGFNPYFIQGGGHGNLGTQAYVKVYKEILDYEKQSGIEFDYIFHASGTGTTQAGLISGNVIYESNKIIVGVSIARKNPYGSNIVIDSVNNYLKVLGKNFVNDNEVEFIDDYVLNGYGSYDSRVLKIIKDVLIKDSIPMDTTYTGKAFWGMQEYIKKHRITGKRILFIHTGGTPLFFDKLEEIIDEL